MTIQKPYKATVRSFFPSCVHWGFHASYIECSKTVINHLEETWTPFHIGGQSPHSAQMQRDDSGAQMNSPSGHVDLDGMINDQISWTFRVDLLWISPEALDRIPHGSKVHHSRDASVQGKGGKTLEGARRWETEGQEASREVLQDDTGGFEGDLHIAALVLLPVEQALHILRVHFEAVAVTHHWLQQDPHGVWQAVCNRRGPHAARAS